VLGYRLLHSKLATGPSYDTLSRTGLHELKAVAEGVSLANQRVNLNRTHRQIEFQPNHLADRNLDAQHRRNARFTDIHRVAPHNRRIARIDTYVHFQLVTRMAASFHKFASLTTFDVTPRFQFRPLSLQRWDKPNGRG
jgi:hypothetical protein